MAMANMNLIGVFVTKLWPVQALACGGGGEILLKYHIVQLVWIHGHFGRRMMHSGWGDEW